MEQAQLVISALPHLLALKDRPFTRWHELTGREQESYKKEAARLIHYGSEHDIVIKNVLGIMRDINKAALQ